MMIPCPDCGRPVSLINYIWVCHDCGYCGAIIPGLNDMWVVFILQREGSVTAGGVALKFDMGLIGFLPVFKTEEDARAYAAKSGAAVHRIEEVRNDGLDRDEAKGSLPSTT